ncbi:hypothetical protein [Desulfitobacterium sp.]|uniref:hypothetical protein n=1 Tax=Desulfitobacterium sp. TaxID=49981 RepID=UPI002BD73185|nr:hypothetical protein [Desulfitobacterium sp.]HVJ49226.1 hypothetical protein [Desulfitobacterium sp.]
MENLYEINGLTDYKLKTPEDLLKTHGIDHKAIDGYNRLDDVNRSLYEKFIVNFFNGQGLDSRMSLIPKGIYYVEDLNYLAKENPEDDHLTIIGGLVTVIDRNGMKTVLRSWEDEDYAHLVEEFPEAITESTPNRYLRFEYEHHGRNEWLHVKSENSWY